MLGALLHEYRSHRMARFTFWLIVYGAILEIVQAGEFRPGLEFITVMGVLRSLFVIGAVVAVIYYIGRLISFVRRRLLWRLTWRLIAIYLFIAFVPIILILSMVCMGGLILNGQFAAFLVNEKLQNHYDELKQLNRVVAHEATHTQTRSPQKLFDWLQDFYVNDLRQYASSYPGLEITLRIGDQARAFRLTGEPISHPESKPRWFTGEEWAGIVMSDQELCLRALDQEEEGPAGHLTLILSLPLTPQLLNMIGEGIGPVGVIPLESMNRKTGAKGENVEIRRGPSVHSDAVPVPSPRMWLDLPVHGFSALHPVEWHAAAFRQRDTPILVTVSSRIFTLNGQLLRILGKFADTLVVAFVIVVGVFLVIEIIALVIGVKLTRSITSTVNRLQLATEAVKAGNFAHRVGLAPRDQVSALGAAFDTMTASLERLIAESHEKLRLESELKIAEEVQRQLFPQCAPVLPGAQMFGECRPARGVSGDYYDFLKLNRERVGLALGDVSGKGIYAALLMAGIQSAMRAQFYDGHLPDGLSGASHLSTATVLRRLNHQLYENTPDSKYATFFYAIYDAQTRILVYTNAGHPAPFLFRRNKLLRLETGGTVLGLFPSIQYQQEQIDLEPGDLLLAFTDGLVEAENSYGEEFGEDRLATVVRESMDAPPEILAQEIYRTIIDWAGSTELQDDMTLLYLKTTN